MVKQEEQKQTVVQVIRLPAFDPAPNCPKCKGKKVSMKHSAAPSDGRACINSATFNIMPILADAEYVQVACQTCGYWWLMACADRPEAAAKD